MRKLSFKEDIMLSSMSVIMLADSLTQIIPPLALGASTAMFIANGPRVSSILLPVILGSLLFCLATITIRTCELWHCLPSLTFTSIVSSMLIASQTALAVFRFVSYNIDILSSN